MMQIILHVNDRCEEITRKGTALSEIIDLGVFDTLAGMKYEIPNDHPEEFDKLYQEIDGKLDEFAAKQKNKN